MPIQCPKSAFYKYSTVLVILFPGSQIKIIDLSERLFTLYFEVLHYSTVEWLLWLTNLSQFDCQNTGFFPVRRSNSLIEDLAISYRYGLDREKKNRHRLLRKFVYNFSKWFLANFRCFTIGQFFFLDFWRILENWKNYWKICQRSKENSGKPWNF